MSTFLRRSAPIAILLCIGFAAFAHPPSTVLSAVPAPTFHVPVVSGVQGYGYEQDLRLDTKGRVYTSAPDSASSTTSFVWRSLDRGQTFKLIPGATQPNGKLVSCIGGGDTELATDSRDNLYFNDLTLANFSTFRSSDQGRTLVPQSCTSVTGTVVDRQWYAVDGDPTNGGSIFLAFDRVAQTTPVTCPNGVAATPAQNALVMDRSPVTSALGATAGTQFGPDQVISCDEGIMGNNEFFNYQNRPAGQFNGKRVFVIHDNIGLSSTSMGRCDVVDFTVSPSGLSNCKDILISSFPNSITGGDFPTMAVDKAGNLYAFWEQAPITRGDGVTIPNKVTGNTALMYSVSTDEGETWSDPNNGANHAAVLPTGAEINNVFAWPAAGDIGRVDVAWYGTPASCDATCQARNTGTQPPGTQGGPDQVKGDWSVWMTQTQDGGKTWLPAPVQASGHFIHRGNIQTLIGGQEGDRSLGDFIQLRIGLDGEANISYGDSNNRVGSITPQAMVVRQNGGASVLNAPLDTVNGGPALANSVVDPPNDATFDSGGVSSPNLDNLDILGSSMSMPDAQHYRITMKVKNLSSLAPSPQAGGTDLVWLTQWHVPSSSDSSGGKIFHAYMESTAGQAPQCFDGENGLYLNGGGAGLTYPGNSTPLPAADCQYSTSTGTITITVPVADVKEASPISSTLFSVNASTQTLSAPANSIPSPGGIGGVPPNLIDVAPTYNFTPGGATASRISVFTARRVHSNLRFHWRLAVRSEVVGFNLYVGTRRINRSLIRTHSGHDYRYAASASLHGQFSLHVVLTGNRQLAVPAS